jgi:hypothetical protein
MPMHAEDVYEDLDEADDEDIEDALGEDSDISERRRRRRKARGGGYNKPRIEKSFVTQAQLQAASERIGKDIRTIDASVKSLENTARRSQNSMGQNMQMMALMPMLMKKTITTTGASGGIPSGTKVVIDDGDMLTMMLPMMMMQGMGSGSTTGQNGQGGMDPMMMMMMVLIMSDQGKRTTP